VGIAILVLRAYLRMKTIKSVPESDRIKVLTDKNFSNQIKNGREAERMVGVKTADQLRRVIKNYK